MSGNTNSFSRTDDKDDFNPAENIRGQPRPEHHLHRESEPLLGNDPMSHGQDQPKDTGMWKNGRGNGASPPCRPPTIIPTTSATMSVLTTAISLLGLGGIHQWTSDFQDS